MNQNNNTLKSDVSPNDISVGSRWCPYHLKDMSPRGHYDVNPVSNIPYENQAENPNVAMPPSPPNGGLYGGPQSTKPWANIPVIPTTTNYISKNLVSANPPPGATVQYPGGSRLGNNHTSMPGVYWYNPDIPEQLGMHRLKTV